ncbi:DUF4232 domain-containing protein [Rothia nasimurium]|uniref:DUF4232 domain-containing protein n=1 Tax=Rothia nasimurium TaxID=85336 RepID=UPI003BA175C1
MRTQHILPLLALGASLLLAGCSATSPTSHEASSSTANASTQAAATSSETAQSTTDTPSASSAAPSVQATAPASAAAATPSSPAPPVVTEQQPSVETSTEPAPPRGTVITVEPTEPTTTVQPVPSPGSSSAAGVAICDYGQLYVEAAATQGAAGSRYIDLTFTNTGTSRCVMSGYPSVHYVDASGKQIGAPAANATEWSSTGGVLAPGSSIRATLRETHAQLYGETCQSVSAAGYSVQAPGSSQPLVMAFAAEACSNSAVSQLSVGAVGAAP